MNFLIELRNQLVLGLLMGILGKFLLTVLGQFYIACFGQAMQLSVCGTATLDNRTVDNPARLSIHPD